MAMLSYLCLKLEVYIIGIILPQEVEVCVSGGAANYYEDKGYKIPRYYNKEKYGWQIKKGQTVKINVKDLAPSSNVFVECKCDICGKQRMLRYNSLMKNIEANNGKYSCRDTKLHSYILSAEKIETIKNELLFYLKDHGEFPKYNEYIQGNGFTYTYTTIQNICKKQNTCLNDLQNEIDCFKTTVPSVKYYDKYIDRLKEIINDDISVATNLLTFERTFKNNLPTVRWLIDNCPDKTVHDVHTFKKYLGYYNNKLTKEECIDIIINMQENLDRPLMYDDFRNAGYGDVSINTIKKYWGSMNQMKKALGLEINQVSMIDRVPTVSDLETVISDIVSYVNDMHKEFITEREIEDFSTKNDSIHYVCMDKWCKKYFKMSLCEKLKSCGVSMSNPGNGIVHDFDDGERTTSQFEYMFSTYLRNLGFTYGKDYFRDVRYSSIDSSYKGMMNCDYVINHNENTIYIEIAGLIEMYKTWYYSGRQITISKSKEKYRRKLYEKEQMFKRNNLTYFILFPCDLTRDILNRILKNPTDELRKEIEKRYKNNIDWTLIQKTGELKYKNELGRDKQPIVDYGEAI